MADTNFTSSDFEGLEYHQLIWGDLIHGTKEQLMRLRIGRNIQFPESYRKRVKCLDPRGFPTEISVCSYKPKGIFSASISFPGRSASLHDEAWKPYALGVERCQHPYCDEYRGSADSLVAAGLANDEFFPGQPGMGKVQVTLNADGTRRTCNNSSKKTHPGDRIIKKISSKKYLVRIVNDKDVCEYRAKESLKRDEEWRKKMNSLPRPKPLMKILNEQELYIQKEKSLSLSDVKDRMIDYVRINDSVLFDCLSETNYQLSSEAKALIAEHIDSIKRICRLGTSYRVKNNLRLVSSNHI